MRYKVNKIGMLNFWLYDEEELDFYGGNMILRGTNGSGKSVTMQSFIPLILDGNKSPERLDPFGSKERKIEDYILGYSDEKKEEAISYLYMECKKGEKYITVGLGFRGRKGRPVDSWGFALKDGKRIGKDFFLYKDKTNKIPLTKNELKARLGVTNEFTNTNEEYKEMVNRLLFGFPVIGMYDEFIKLLLQLRSNKLSKDYKPTNLVGVLNSVLEPLSEEELLPLSESINEMNKTKNRLEILQNNKKALKSFLIVYKNYNEIVLINKARKYAEVEKSYQTQKQKLDNLIKEIEKNEEDLIKNKNRLEKVKENIESDNQIKKDLGNDDIKNKIEKLESLEEEIKKLGVKIKEIEENRDKTKEESLDINQKITKLDDEIYKLENNIKEITEDLKALSDEAYFDEIVFFSDELLENINQPYSFESIEMSLKSFQNKVKKVKSFLEEEERVLLSSESTREEFQNLENEYKKLENNLEVNNKKLKEEILKWQENFIDKNNKNEYLLLDDNVKTEIFTLMNEYTNENYQKADNIYKDYSRSKIDEIKDKNIKLENILTEKEEEYDNYQRQYINLKNEDLSYEAKNPNIDKILDDKNIKYESLYKVIEFKDNISEEEKDMLESSLNSLGILDAKIIEEKDIDKIKDIEEDIVYLTKTKEKAKNILKYLNVKSEKFEKEYIEDILKSISLDEADIINIGLDKNKLDFINVKNQKKYKQTYIGYLKRLEIKNTKLEKLKKLMDSISSEIENIKTVKEENIRKIEEIKEETIFEPNDYINVVSEDIVRTNMSMNWTDEKLKKLETKLTEIDGQIRKLRENIKDSTKGLYIPLNLNAYNNAEKHILAIKETLSNLKFTHNQMLNKIDMHQNFKERLDSINNNLEYLEEEKSEREKNLNISVKNRDSLNELLNSGEYKKQKEKLIKIEEELISLNREKEELLINTSKLEESILYQTENKEEIIREKERIKELLITYEDIFKREYNLKYVYEEELNGIVTAKKIVKDGQNKRDLTVGDALDNFYKSYNHYRLELSEYSLKNITLFTDYEGKTNEKIYEENRRADVTAMYQGVKVNIIELAKKIEDDIEESKNLISEQDRHLFEDILLNTVGDKIRNKIASSQNWVSKINNIMNDIEENSALSFKLVWKSISAQNEGEIDTKEIVRILKMDPKLLKDTDSSKLTNHFRTKLKKAEELNEDSYISFYKIVEEILDYRSWFTFKLEYKRKGENYKELTDKTFSKFSGGERAKSMYIPLFASVYAKFISAKEDSLRIIALDEAFAGVDEENIREMFGILKYLDIDFIINSQSLWGDYDTVQDLSICELIRPLNSKTVTVERYRWNGEYKKVVTNRDEEDA